MRGEREQAVSPDQRQDAALALLEQGVSQVLAAGGMERYLTVASRFPDYSAHNCLLILTQRPDATRVAGFRQWQQLGRQVQKGEKAIKIIVPHLRKGVSQETGEPEEQLLGFGVGNVFDVTQTDGDPLPEPPTPAALVGDQDVAQAVDRKLGAFLIDEGVQVEKALLMGARGRFSPRQWGREVPLVQLSQTLPFGLDSAKTLAHEAAHYVAEHHGIAPKAEVETVAEGSAFVVMRHYGLDTSDYSFPYIARWARSPQVVTQQLSEIQRVSRHLISAIEGPERTRR